MIHPHYKTIYFPIFFVLFLAFIIYVLSFQYPDFTSLKEIDNVSNSSYEQVYQVSEWKPFEYYSTIYMNHIGLRFYIQNLSIIISIVSLWLLSIVFIWDTITNKKRKLFSNFLITYVFVIFVLIISGYVLLRQKRYPTWEDSIGLNLFSEIMTVTVLFALFILIYSILHRAQANLNKACIIMLGWFLLVYSCEAFYFL